MVNIYNNIYIYIYICFIIQNQRGHELDTDELAECSASCPDGSNRINTTGRRNDTRCERTLRCTRCATLPRARGAHGCAVTVLDPVVPVSACVTDRPLSSVPLEMHLFSPNRDTYALLQFRARCMSEGVAGNLHTPWKGWVNASAYLWFTIYIVCSCLKLFAFGALMA